MEKQVKQVKLHHGPAVWFWFVLGLFGFSFYLDGWILVLMWLVWFWFVHDWFCFGLYLDGSVFTWLVWIWLVLGWFDFGLYFFRLYFNDFVLVLVFICFGL